MQIKKEKAHINSSHSESLLKVKDLALYYGKVAAFENISINFKTDSITSIIGPSGCGKTSFLKSLNRLSEVNPNTSLKGSISYRGENILSSKYDILNLRKKIGLIFQKPSPFPFSIKKNIELGLKEHGIKRKDEREHIIEEALRSVGLWGEVKDRLSLTATNLSGGQQQRLCIARAIALKPEMLLFDEPCSALDPISSKVVEELIVSLRGNYTVAVVTHNIAQAKRISDNVAFFWLKDKAGSLIEYGSTEQIFNSPKNDLTYCYITGARG